MNKSQQQLLDRIDNSVDGRICIELITGRGPQGGIVNEGVRQWNAYRQLKRLGVVKGDNSHKSVIAEGGYTTWSQTVWVSRERGL